MGHKIVGKRKGKETSEHNLTSFASKFCGSHNQKAPFWDNLVSDLLNYLGYKYQYRNYRAYVEQFSVLQKKLRDDNIGEYSLRDIESAMWHIADKAVNY